jgi:hypothetical protein
MKKLLLAFAVAACAAFGFAMSPAQAADPAGTLCGSVHVQVNGSDVVNQASCQVLPPA